MGSNLDKIDPELRRAYERVHAYDAPVLPEGWIVEGIARADAAEAKMLPFLTFKLPTSAYTGRTAKGRARRS